MYRDYSDIRDLIPEPPQWFDEYAVPRYKPFSPRLIANIYASEAVLLRIACQGCGRDFLVAMSWSSKPPASLADLIREGHIHYGDPPNTGCCDSGPTMNSEPRQVLEYWSRSDRARSAALRDFPRDAPQHEAEALYRKAMEGLSAEQQARWDRDPSLEIAVPPRWGA